ncbi:Hypothetical predicted protein [Paramuricea clavata]|uniref:Uncharacterized protein n=1 Tax=Paramuricea clavata TaxID=317549 RepID=A0A7D9ISQ1_PARCT|nr:Hypothetical predicted protein [Paramuricea clavata]
MASVVFIIRVPYYEENSKSLKSEWDSESESSEGNKEEDIKRQTDDQNVKEVTFEISENKTDKAFHQNQAEVYGDTSEANQTVDDMEMFTGHLNLAEVLQNELRSLNVQGDSWTITNDKQFHQVVFLEKTGERVEKFLERLTHVGIGKRPKSSVSIIPTSVHIQPQENKKKRATKCESILTTESETEPLLSFEKESIKDQFKKSIKSRLTVEQVVESVRMQAHLSFDFVMFTVLASLIAAVGLAEDNACCGDGHRYINITTYGFLFGLICGPFGVNGASWDNTKRIWPTNEMTSRGMTRALWVGVCIALPSGAAVALSVLGGNTGSLVGVTISASLLAPAVNSLKCPPLKDNGYTPTYSCNMGMESAILAIISLVLTVENIICILITATLVLKIKEVAPKASSSNATQTFWTKDIKVAREAYETVNKSCQAYNFLKEWKKVQDRSKAGSRNSLQENEEFVNIIEEVERTEEFESVVRRAPRGAQNLHKFLRHVKRLVSKEEPEDSTADKEAMILKNTLRNLQTYYSLHPTDKAHQPYVSTIFSESEAKPKKGVRKFHVVETENPHHTSVVRVQPPTDDSNTYSVTTESGV